VRLARVRLPSFLARPCSRAHGNYALEAGEELTYTLTFGNRSAALAPNTQLRLPLPPGTSFLNATGAVVANRMVTWDLGTVAPGQGGTRQLTVELDSEEPLGEVLLEQAEIGEAGVGTNATRATAATRVERGVPVDVAMEITPDPATQGALLLVALEAMSLAPVNSSLTLGVRVPSQVLAFAAASTGGGAAAGRSTASRRSSSPGSSRWWCRTARYSSSCHPRWRQSGRSPTARSFRSSPA
jgi:uncharacterized repeat protein (TIGR01451 family)